MENINTNNNAGSNEKDTGTVNATVGKKSLDVLTLENERLQETLKNKITEIKNLERIKAEHLEIINRAKDSRSEQDIQIEQLQKTNDDLSGQLGSMRLQNEFVSKGGKIEEFDDFKRLTNGVELKEEDWGRYQDKYAGSIFKPKETEQPIVEPLAHVAAAPAPGFQPTGAEGRRNVTSDTLLNDEGNKVQTLEDFLGPPPSEK